MYNQRRGAHGLPLFGAYELRAVRANGYAAVLVMVVAGNVMIGATGSPNQYIRNLQQREGAPVRVVSAGWAPDAALARRVRDQAGSILEGRQVGREDRFDVPEEYALAAVDAAARKIGISLHSTPDILRVGAVQRAKHASKYGRLDLKRNLV